MPYSVERLVRRFQAVWNKAPETSQASESPSTGSRARISRLMALLNVNSMKPVSSMRSPARVGRTRMLSPPAARCADLAGEHVGFAAVELAAPAAIAGTNLHPQALYRFGQIAFEVAAA